MYNKSYTHFIASQCEFAVIEMCITRYTKINMKEYVNMNNLELLNEVKNNVTTYAQATLSFIEYLKSANDSNNLKTAEQKANTASRLAQDTLLANAIQWYLINDKNLYKDIKVKSFKAYCEKVKMPRATANLYVAIGALCDIEKDCTIFYDALVKKACSTEVERLEAVVKVPLTDEQKEKLHKSLKVADFGYSQLLAFVRNRGKYEKEHGENTAISFINSLISEGQITATTEPERIADYLRGKFITEAGATEAGATEATEAGATEATEAEATEEGATDAGNKIIYKRIEFDCVQADILYNALSNFIKEDIPNDSPERALLAKLYEFRQKFLQE